MNVTTTINELVFFVSGTPVPKGRARSGANGRHYTPARTRAWEHRVAIACRAAASRARWAVATCLVRLEIAVGAPRGDVDNHAKSVSDAMNGIAWGDDRQVDDLRVHRLHDGTEGAHVRVTKLEEGAVK